MALARAGHRPKIDRCCDRIRTRFEANDETGRDIDRFGLREGNISPLPIAFLIDVIYVDGAMTELTGQAD
jgi:hypothetical protein